MAGSTSPRPNEPIASSSSCSSGSERKDYEKDDGNTIVVRLKSGNFVAEQGKDGTGESVDKQFIEGDKVKLHGIHTRGTTKVWDLEGVEGIVESTTIWAGAVNPTAATDRMTRRATTWAG